MIFERGTMIDWTKPIQFKNGTACKLIETNLDGWKQWGSRLDGTYPTRCIHRLDLPEGSPSAYWFVHEDGKTKWPAKYGYDIVNVEEKPPP